LREHNDYASLVRQYLHDYNQFEVTRSILRKEKDLQEQTLSSYKVAIAKYGDSPGGGSSNTSQVENMVEQRLKIESRISRINMDIAEITHLLDSIDQAVEGLHDEERTIIKEKFLEGKSWGMIAQKMYISEKWAREKSNKAIKEMAFMIWGSEARPEQLSFVFAVHPVDKIREIVDN
jgi:RinA family phage transcriptional activator